MYLFWLSLLISMEGIYSQKRSQELDGNERLLFHISEWVAFAVLIKALSYLANDPAQLLQDLSLWQNDFIQNFITVEYLFGLALIALVWFSSLAYESEFSDLYNREMDATWDELGKIQNQLRLVRNRISSRVFAIGTLVVIMAAFSRTDFSAVVKMPGGDRISSLTPVINVLVYFLLALVLLSQTQFSLLRARWLWQKLTISPQIGQNWIKSALLFFAALTVVVFLLPTHYSIGLLDTLRYAIQVLLQILSGLVALLLLPFTICMSLFSAFSSPVETKPPPQGFPPPPIINTVGNQPIAWLEFLRSLAFWLIFTGVIFWAIRYYLSQNTRLWNAIIHFPLIGWMSRLWSSVSRWLKGANRQVTTLIKSGLQRLQDRRDASPAGLIRRAPDFKRMNPRQKVIYLYLNMLHTAQERGFSRPPAQTPLQYEKRLNQAIPEVQDEVHTLTDTFMEARFSEHPINPPEAEKANNLWEKIKSVLSQIRYPTKES